MSSQIRSYRQQSADRNKTNLLQGLYLYQLFPFIIFPVGHSSCPGHRYDSQAFLYSLVNKPGWAPVKLPQTGQYSYSKAHSIYDCSDHGPTFGYGWDIYFSGSTYSTYIGYTYNAPSGYNYGDTFTYTFLHGGSDQYFTPDEMEIFYETT